MRSSFACAIVAIAQLLAGNGAVSADFAVPVAQTDDPARAPVRQQQYTATIQALRTLEAMLASATLDDEARRRMRAQLEALLKQFEGSHPAEVKIARLKLEMSDIRDKQGGAISGGNLEVFADQESRLRRRELEILMEIRELEKEIGRGQK